MEFFADLHIHSRYSRATSKSLTLPLLCRHAQLKGIGVVGTGDFTHPGWFAEIGEQLEPAEPGLFRLRPELLPAAQQAVPGSCQQEVRFLLTVEISNIYKRAGRTRKVHNLLLVPGLEAAARLTERLARIGNLRSDGRPILGLDSRDLLEIVLETDPLACLIPAHIWTPWFSALGSFSGFDSIADCYADLATHVFALETGLSSDPAMNWRVSSLDRYALVSSSDAHSAEKLGREACRFGCVRSYPAMLEALRNPAAGGFQGTVEFFPEEGKYHLDGHRGCGVRLSPEETRACHALCPTCGKPVTVGVLSRVDQLADRPAGHRPPGAAPYVRLIPLAEIVGELLQQGAATRGVQQACDRLLRQLGPELPLLTCVPLDEIGRHGTALLAEAVRRMRAGEVHCEAGYDGEYGKVQLFAPGELTQRLSQLALLGGGPAPAARRRASPPRDHEPPRIPPLAASPAAPPADAGATSPPTAAPAVDVSRSAGPPLVASPRQRLLDGLNEPQAQVVRHRGETPLLVLAGPGTGKTRVLTHRLAWLLLGGEVSPEQVLAVTFTIKAAGELRSRLANLVGPELAARLAVGTFHSLCLELLCAHAGAAGLPHDFGVLDAPGQQRLFEQVAHTAGLLPPGRRTTRRDLELLALARAHQGAEGVATWLAQAAPTEASRLTRLQCGYLAQLQQQGLVDFDGLLERAIALLATDLVVRDQVCGRLRVVAVDEYQDVNAVQAQLVRLWAAGCPGGLVAIGDPDQAIYRFRGADCRHFLRFGEEWPGATVLRLGQSYRSTDIILQASRQALAGEHAGDGLWSGIAGDAKVLVRGFPTAEAEAEGVVQLIEQAVGGIGFFSLDSRRVGAGEAPGGLSFGEIAVLYRTHALAGLLEEALERSGIPYQRAGGRLALEEVGLLLTVLSLIPAGRPLLPAVALEELGETVGGTPEQAATLVAQLALLGGPAARRQPVASLLVRVLELLGELVPAAQRPLLALAGAHLGRLAQPAEELGSFLTRMALLREGDDLDPRAERVQLMSLHAAKGLEFPLVLIIGCEEGLIPFRRPGDEAWGPEDEAEERRLLYVGMTRARRRLVLSWAARRSPPFASPRQPSSFLAAIAEGLRQIEQGGPGPRRAGSAERQLLLEL